MSNIISYLISQLLKKQPAIEKQSEILHTDSHFILALFNQKFQFILSTCFYFLVSSQFREFLVLHTFHYEKPYNECL